MRMGGSPDEPRDAHPEHQRMRVGRLYLLPVSLPFVCKLLPRIRPAAGMVRRPVLPRTTARRKMHAQRGVSASRDACQPRKGADLDDLLADFLTETNESLAELDSALVKLEQTPDDAETLGLIFRLVHTIKGTCGFLGLPRLERVAHAGENVLGKLRDHTLTVTPEIITNVLVGIDRIKDIVAGLAETGIEAVGDDIGLINALNAIAAGDAPVEPTSDASSAETTPTAAAEAAFAGTPAAATAVPEPIPQPATPPVTAAAVSPAKRETPVADGPTQAAAPAAAAQTIRVTVDVLEDLMTLVSELVLTRNQLLQLARVQENSAFAVPLQRLSHITSDLQEGVMKTRMQPIGNAWNKLPRLVRDLSHDMNKKIELVMLGADTELDRQILELIKDPLTHMIRNSADHGLETTGGTKALGKPETGRIVLNAFHEGGHIILEMSDDGRGLAVDKIKAKVLSQQPGDRSRARAHERRTGPPLHLQGRILDRNDRVRRFRPRRRHGRGEDQHREDRRHRRSQEHPGKGTMFTIKIPLTLAIVSALIVEACGERFAIPQISVVELVRAQLAAGDNNPQRERECHRADQRHAGIAVAKPSAAAGQPDGTAETRRQQDRGGRGRRRRRAGRRPYDGDHRRPGVRHRRDRGQARGADPAPRHDVQRQHHPRRRLRHHDPRSQRHRPPNRRRSGQREPAGTRQPNRRQNLLREDRHAALRRRGKSAHGRPARTSSRGWKIFRAKRSKFPVVRRSPSIAAA